MVESRLRLCLCSLGLAAVAVAAPLRVGVELAAPPMAYVDEQGVPRGFTPELLEAMEATGLVEIEVVPNYWTNHLRDVQAGTLDALANVVYRPDRVPVLDYSIGHAKVHGMVYRRLDQRPFKTTRDFSGKVLGSLLGTVAHSHAKAHPEWGAELRDFRSWEAALEATARGETDATIMLSPLLNQMVNRHGLKADFIDDIIHQYHFAVRPGDRATLAKLNEALAAVRHNGDFDRIYAKWIGPIEPRSIRLADLRPYYLPVVVFLLAVSILFWWQRRMLRRLARQADALRESEERWKFAVEGSGDGVWDYDCVTGRAVRSRRWKEMLGFDESEIGTGLDEWKDRIHPEDRAAVEQAMQALEQNGGSTFMVEHRLRCKDGSWKWLLNRGMVMSRTPEGRPRRIIGTHTDLTARKQAEEDRLVLGKLESTGGLAGGIAHDFNNLLTAILLNLELAQLTPGTPADVLGRLEGAQKAALSARGLTQQLITFARGDAALPRMTDIGELLRESVPLALTGSSVRGDVHAPSELWPALVDSGQIGQVIRNLVLNAREAMPKGGVITLRAANVVLGAGEHHNLPPGEYVHITVSDAGDGIRPEILPKIFDPYYSTKQRGPQRGMGLGLTICHSIVQKHKGTITVESVLHHGTTFHIHLPAAPRAVVEPVATGHEAPARSARPGRILVMDDEPAIQQSVARALEQMGHTVEIAGDGRTAVNLHAIGRATGRPFAAAILDLTVPGGMGGLDAIKAMRASEPGLKAVVMSGYANNAVMQDWTSHGFDAALKKPFDIASLHEALEPLLVR